MYIDTGHRISDKLWNETMEVLEFGSVGELLKNVKHEYISLTSTSNYTCSLL